MSLYESLQKAISEEDVKDLYIKALNLKVESKNLVDIQTKEIWFEAKLKPTSTYAMFTQLIYYIRKAKECGEYIPPFLCCVDSKKASIMETVNVEQLLLDKKIKWEKAKSASQVTLEMINQISSYIGTHLVSYNLESYEEEFKEAIKLAISSNKIIRTQITPNNLKQVFDNWVNLIGKEINNIESQDFALLFYADIMSDGTEATHKLDAQIIHKNGKPAFALNGTIYELSSFNGYKEFWAIYSRPPLPEYRNYLLERRDSLIAIDERTFKGAYYTPLKVVDKAYDYLNMYLGKNWQKDYIVWDMCCGVGNLEVKHSNHRNIFMSTLDSEDVNIIKSTKTCVASERFQYDYLNDDIAEDGTINYSLSNKVPKSLQDIIKNGTKKVLVLINPPYAEMGSGIGPLSKTGVAKTNVAEFMMQGYGKATNELFTQFVARITKELPNCTLAMFSKLKYVNAPNFESFRQQFKAQYKGGFIVHSKAFDGLKGDFPIGFLIWNLAKKQEITNLTVDVFSKSIDSMGDKTFYNLPISTYLNKWLKKPKANTEFAVPLKNAISVGSQATILDKWSDNAIGYMCASNNDLQHSGQLTFLLSSTFGDLKSGGFYVTPENLLQASAIFTARKIIKHTWINDRDQFLQPKVELSQEFYNDCLIYMLFHNSNLTASTNNLEYLGNKYSLINHFFPFTESEVEAESRFSSNFMQSFIAKSKFSIEAKQVLKAGKELYKLYFKQDFNHKIREELKLDVPDVGYYQIRKALSGLETPVDFTDIVNAYSELTDKLLQQVYDFGFLKV